MEMGDYFDYLIKFSTILSTIFAGWAAIAASSAARAAIRQAKISQDALIIDQRAWLNVNLLPAGDLEIFPTGIQIFVQAFVKNIGRTPALDARSNIAVVHDMSLIIQKLKDLALENEKSVPFSGRMVLPGEEYGRPWAVTFEDDLNSILEDGYISSFIVGVTTYKIINDDGYHHTGFAYSCERFSEDIRIWHPLRVDVGNIPKSEIVFSAISGGFAT